METRRSVVLLLRKFENILAIIYVSRPSRYSKTFVSRSHTWAVSAKHSNSRGYSDPCATLFMDNIESTSVRGLVTRQWQSSFTTHDKNPRSASTSAMWMMWSARTYVIPLISVRTIMCIMQRSASAVVICSRDAAVHAGIVWFVYLRVTQNRCHS